MNYKPNKKKMNMVKKNRGQEKNAENKEKKYFENEAKRYDVQYVGMQEFPDGKLLPMFDHICYGTFVIGHGEVLGKAILRKQKQFETNENK